MRGALVVLALLAVACGGGPLSKAEYAERAAKICADLDEDVRRASRTTNPESATGLFASSAAANEHRREAIAALRELGPPAEDAELAESMIAAMERQVEHLEALQEAVTGGEPSKAVDLITEAATADAEAKRAAEEFGIAPCAR